MFIHKRVLADLISHTVFISIEHDDTWHIFLNVFVTF